MKLFLKTQISFLLYGFIFWFPIAVLIIVIAFLLGNLETLGGRVLIWILPDNLVKPGLGIALGVVIIYLSGILLRLTRVRSLFSNVPVIGLFFGGGEMMTVDRLAHMKPCLFAFSPTCLSYGWILSREQVRLNNGRADFDLVNVYYPNVPTLVTGQVFPVRRDTVIQLGNTSKEIFDLLLYSFRSPTEIKYLPWEDETPGEFVRRAKALGLNQLAAIENKAKTK